MASVFYKMGSTITGASGLSFKTQIKAFRTHFGVNPHVCNVIYKKIKTEFNVVVCRIYLLWSLYFLCSYPKVKVIRKMFSVDVKTFRKHTSRIIVYIKRLNVVSVIELFKNIHFTDATQIKFSAKLKSLDATDFRIREPSPFSPMWWSFKFNAAALRYEIALEVDSGYVVWAYGGFPPGPNRDVDIAKKKFIKKLLPHE